MGECIVRYTTFTGTEENDHEKGATKRIILQSDCAGVLTHARLADLHNIHSTVNAALSRRISWIQPYPLLPQGLSREASRPKSALPEGLMSIATEPYGFLLISGIPNLVVVCSHLLRS